MVKANRNALSLIVPWFFGCALLLLARIGHTDETPWILVDSDQETLSVVADGRLIVVFSNVSFGRGGVGPLRERGDAKTPTGEFQIAWVNRNSRYHLFFGLDYPNLDFAERAYNTRLIDFNDYRAIKLAFDANQTPPQNTRLGGNIGIHGLGNADPEIHRRLNWTDGCVALTNQQIDELAEWVSIGTKVVIR